MEKFRRYRIWCRIDGVITTKIAFGPGIKTKYDAVAFLKLNIPSAEIGQVELA
jgi:hypothetical protein